MMNNLILHEIILDTRSNDTWPAEHLLMFTWKDPKPVGLINSMSNPVIGIYCYNIKFYMVIL